MSITAEKKFQTLDIYLSSFLSLSGFPPGLEVNNDGKVVFVFTLNDELGACMSTFINNNPVPVADFVTALKSLRGQMLSKKFMWNSQRLTLQEHDNEKGNKNEKGQRHI